MKIFGTNTLETYLIFHLHVFTLGWPVTEDELKEVAHNSGVLETESDFLDPEFRKKCEDIIPSPQDVELQEFVDAYLYLNHNFPTSSCQ